MRFLAFIATLILARVAAAAAPLAGLAYSPSGVTEFSQLAAGISEARIRADLEQLKPLTNEIRIYTVSYGLDRVVPIAASLGMKVTVGVFQGRDPVVNAAEISRAIGIVKNNRAAVTRVIVGNESVQRGDRSVDDIIAAMEVMRRGVNGGIPVGTSEIWSIWEREPRLADASAFIGAHIIPYWDGVDINQASIYVLQRVDELREAYPGKPIVISETGWPWSGPAHEGSFPSPANQAKFAEIFATSGTARTNSYFLDEAYDQPWKAKNEGDVPLWGLFDVARHPKPAVEGLQRMLPRAQ